MSVKSTSKKTAVVRTRLEAQSALIWTRHDDRGAACIQRPSGRVADRIAADAGNQRRQPAVVVQTEVGLLHILEERGNSSVGFQRTWQRAGEIAFRVVELVAGDALVLPTPWPRCQSTLLLSRHWRR